MKAVFGVLSLLIVLAVLAITAKHQLKATVIAPLPADATVTGTGTGTGSPAATVPDQARALQDRVRVDTARSLQRGADRAASADQ